MPGIWVKAVNMFEDSLHNTRQRDKLNKIKVHHTTLRAKCVSIACLEWPTYCTKKLYKYVHSKKAQNIYS